VGIRFTNPWWVVAGAVTGLVVCNGPVMAFTFGVFLKPLMEDMGWQRGTASFALSFGGIFSALMVPVFGWMMDRWSIRRVALPGIVIYAFAIALLALSPRSFLAFTLLFALAEAASAIQTPIGYAKASPPGSTGGADWRLVSRCRGSGSAASSCRSLPRP
jgi:predicted MFS family arabinose efflux permease